MKQAIPPHSLTPKERGDWQQIETVPPTESGDPGAQRPKGLICPGVPKDPQAQEWEPNMERIDCPIGGGVGSLLARILGSHLGSFSSKDNHSAAPGGAGALRAPFVVVVAEEAAAADEAVDDDTK